MPQYGRPTTDTVNEGYTTQAGGGANLYQTIDEAVADDADYIRSAAAPTSDVYVTKLGTLEDPEVSEKIVDALYAVATALITSSGPRIIESTQAQVPSDQGFGGSAF